MKKQSAITLIALIITIIVMLILVGVTVTIALNGGLFRAAKEATIKKEIAMMQEKLFLIRSELKMKNPLNPMPSIEDTLREALESNNIETVQVSENAEIIPKVDDFQGGEYCKIIPKKLDVSTKRGEGELEDVFVVDQNFNVFYIVKADSTSSLQPYCTGEFKDGVSTPDLRGFNISKTRYVTYSETGETILGNTVDQEPPEEWYEYTNSENPSENRWANIAVIGNEDISYFTWIPRYEYKKDETNVINYIPREQTTPTDGYIIPEAFIWDKTDDGGSVVQLAGFWVSKYKLTLQDNSSIDFTYQTTGASIDITETLATVTGSMKYEFYIAKNGGQLEKEEENNTGKYIFTGLTNGNTYVVSIKAYIVDASGNVTSFVGERTKNICVYTPGKPELTGFNNETTKYVTWDSNGNEIVGNNISGEAPVDWYNYETNSWANIKVENENEVSYFTWVPRYEYRTYKYNNTEKMEINFIPQNKTTPTPGFTIPESFIWDKTDDGGGITHLAGFWVSKYKLTSQDNDSMDFNYKTTGTTLEVTETLTSSTDSMKYEFYISKLGEELQLKEENTTGKYTFTGLTNGETYNVSIKAYKVDTNGNVTSFMGQRTKKICVYTPGKPDLTGFNSNITKYVTWDSEGNEIVGNNISGQAPVDWYNYETNSWANVKVENGDDISYFTWIPRYEYRKYKYNNTEKMEINFIPPNKTTPTPGFTIPEAFTWDMTDDGGEKVNLSGYWVSKYKLSNN